MNAVYSQRQQKLFVNALSCLARFNDKLSLRCAQPAETEYAVNFHDAINAAASAFCSFNLFPEFFDFYELESGRRRFEMLLNIRTLQNVLKTQLNRKLDKCELLLIEDEAESRLAIRLHSFNGVTKTHKLTFEEQRGLFPTSTGEGSRITMDPKTVQSLLEHFGSRINGEISLVCHPERLTIKSRIDDFIERGTRVGRSVWTEVTVDKRYFKSHNLSAQAELTFAMREFKAAIALADHLMLPVELSFTQAGSPLIIKVQCPSMLAEIYIATSLPTPDTSQTSAIRNASVSHQSNGKSAADEASVPNDNDGEVRQASGGRARALQEPPASMPVQSGQNARDHGGPITSTLPPGIEANGPEGDALFLGESSSPMEEHEISLSAEDHRMLDEAEARQESSTQLTASGELQHAASSSLRGNVDGNKAEADDAIDAAEEDDSLFQASEEGTVLEEEEIPSTQRESSAKRAKTESHATASSYAPQEEAAASSALRSPSDSISPRMTDAIRATFAAKGEKNEAVFVAFVTAGFPTKADTVPILLALEAGGADVIELGVPFSDPQADGPAIQESNEIALRQNVDFVTCLRYVSEARQQGLKAPVLLMGYYNPLLAYGEEMAVADAREAGANGFIVVDLPPEEAVDFRAECSSKGMSYIPLIAPSTSEKRIKHLSSLADSFIYVVSKMGTTGVSSSVSTALPDMLSKIRNITDVPLAVGFGVATREHFVEVGEHAEGVVIGSRLVAAIKDAGDTTESRVKAAQAYCEEITNKSQGGLRRSKALSNGPISFKEASKIPDSVAVPKVDGVITDEDKTAIPGFDITVDAQGNLRPPRFGKFGGQYIPEALYDCHLQLEKAYLEAINDPAFWTEFESHYEYIGRPSELYLAERLTEHAGGARIWLKREDLNHTGSHKINNAIGQILLAKRIGKTRIIAETGAGQHGVATATACAKFGLECVIYMGAEDVRRQSLNAFRIKMLGAKVVAVESGSKTLKDAINEANRDWVTNLHNTHYCVGSAIGPHPFPSLVRDFQSIIGKEARRQLEEKKGKLPEAVIACVGGGSNSIGLFHEFVPLKEVRLIGVEAGGDGIDTNRHSATLTKGTPGVLHGVRTYLLQAKDGQITETHSISAGLDYPGVGPEHAYLKDSGRAEYTVATDEEALRGFKVCTELEGIIPALETSHAIWEALKVAKTMKKDDDIIVCCSGRGDKDVEQISMAIKNGGWGKRLGWEIA